MMSLRERNKQRNRAAILDAAFALFRSQGFDQTTMDMIAENAEVSRATLFNYFPTKDSLFLVFAEHALEQQLVPRVQDYLHTSPTVVEVFRFLFMTIYDHVLTVPGMGHIIKQEIFLRPLARALDGQHVGTTYLELVTAILRYGIEKGEVRTDISLDHQAHYIATLYVAIYHRLTFPLSITDYQHEIDTLLAFIAGGLKFHPTA